MSDPNPRQLKRDKAAEKIMAALKDLDMFDAVELLTTARQALINQIKLRVDKLEEKKEE